MLHDGQFFNTAALTAVQGDTFDDIMEFHNTVLFRNDRHLIGIPGCNLLFRLDSVAVFLIKYGADFRRISVNFRILDGI